MRGAIYGRESRDKKTSVANQVSVGEQWMADEGHDVVAVYKDGTSASRFATKARSDWARLITDVSTGAWDLLWLWESSRGDRKLETWAAFLTACRVHKVLIRVESHDRTYNLANARDRRTLAEDGVSAEAESEVLSARVLRGMRNGALKGRPHGRNQYGYQRHYDEHTGQLTSITIHPVQGAVLREAGKRVLRGDTTYAISEDFNRRAIPTPRYGRWTVMTLDRLLRAPIVEDGSTLEAALKEARGRVIRGETLAAIVADYQERKVPPPPTRWDPAQVKELLINPSYNAKRSHNGKIVADAIWPAIFDDDTHARIVARLTDPSRGQRRDSTVKHLLTGIARCGVCGSGLRVSPNRGANSYQCAEPGCRKIARRKDQVEWAVIDAIVKFVQQPDCRDVIAPAVAEDGTQAALLAMETLRARLDGFYEQAAAGELSPAGLARVEQRLLADIESAKQRARRITVAPIVEMLIGPDAESRWEAMTIAQRREVITELVTVLVLPMGRGKRVFDPLSVRIEWRHETWASDGVALPLD